MVDILRKSFAPITEEAWNELEENARDCFGALLTARNLVDFNGPKGWDFAAVNTGRLDIPKAQEIKGLYWGTREVLPLIEIRVPFNLDQMELDSISRGVKDADFEAMEEAAKVVADFEDKLIYHGFKENKIKGILKACSNKPLKVKNDPKEILTSITKGVEILRKQGVTGPYTLAVGDVLHDLILQNTTSHGFPLNRIVKDVLEGDIIWSPALEGGLLLSQRGGDFDLTVGTDLSIGYTSHDRDKIEFYFTESLTFRVLEPAAAVPLEL